MKLQKIPTIIIISILIASFFLNISIGYADGTNGQSTEDHMNGMMGFNILPDYIIIIFLIILGIILLFLIKHKNQRITVLDSRKQKKDDFDDIKILNRTEEGFNEIKTQFCQNCGNNIDIDSKFCDYCGIKL